MKIAIAAEGNNLNSMLSLKGGRAPYYLLIEDGELVEVFKNPFAVGGGGAGWSVAHTLAEKGVKLVILGQIGPNMSQALKIKGIKAKIVSPQPINQLLAEIS